MAAFIVPPRSGIQRLKARAPVAPPTVAMKYVIVIPDGCADEPQESLGGQTPLAAARTPWMDEIARRGVVGRASHVPPGYAPGSDVANLSLLGYDPVACFTGRAPLEAAAQGIELGPHDWAVRCNLVTVQDQTMKSFTADHISTDEAAYLLKTAQERLGDRGPGGAKLEFVPGVSYRNLLLYRGAGAPAPFSRETRTTPPHDLTDKSVCDDFPRGPGSDLLVELMNASATIFAEHPVNVGRVKGGHLPATNVWLWGLGRAPSLTPFADLYGKSGAMITAVDLLRGLAALLGWKRIEAPGATGYLDTDYASKGRTAVAALDEVEVVCVHVEAPDEASHEGRVDAKIEALERIDEQIVGPLFERLQTIGDYRILVSPDHPTPCRTKTHSMGYVPFAISGSGIESAGAKAYSEETAGASSLDYSAGWTLMSYFLGTKTPTFG